jgi:hypothetical protein
VTTHSGRGQGEEGPYEGVVLPSDGAPWSSGQQAAPQQPAAPQPAQGTPWGTPWGPESQAPPLPPGQPPAEDATQMLPPAASYGAQPLPPHTGYGAQPPTDADATQMMPPHPGTPPPVGPDAQATQYMPYPPQHQPQPQPQSQPLPQAYGGYGADAEATQMLPPQAQHPGSPLPPENVGDPHAAAGPPPASAPYGIRPGAPGDRQPPAEFDSLFRTEPAAGPAGGPPPPQPPPAAGWQPAGGGYDGYDGYDDGHDDGGGRGGVSPRVLIGVGVAVLVAIGLITGAALSGGGDGSPQAKDGASPSAAPGGSDTSAGSGDAEAQAKSLDKLLAQSNDSRNAVIGAVQNIKQCKNLQQAAQNLRSAASQRQDLVKKLGGLQTGALPQHDALTAALTKAWNASAQADNAYAAWGDQVAGHKGCHKGKARPTRQQAKGNRASGDASAAKKEAAKLWNPIADKYGLDERQASQL